MSAIYKSQLLIGIILTNYYLFRPNISLIRCFRPKYTSPEHLQSRDALCPEREVALVPPGGRGGYRSHSLVLLIHVTPRTDELQRFSAMKCVT